MRHPRRRLTPAVFVDGSGRRRRLMKLLGVGIGTALAATLGLLILALLPGSAGLAPLLPGGDRLVHDGAPPPAPAPTAAPNPDPVLPASARTPPPGQTTAAPPTSGSEEPTRRGRKPTNTPSHGPKK